jgi:hypothetical protein
MMRSPLSLWLIPTCGGALGPPKRKPLMLKEVVLYEGLGEKKVHSFLCNHHCKIAESEFGFCGLRQNQGGSSTPTSTANSLQRTSIP